MKINICMNVVITFCCHLNCCSNGLRLKSITSNYNLGKILSVIISGTVALSPILVLSRLQKFNRLLRKLKLCVSDGAFLADNLNKINLNLTELSSLYKLSAG